MQFDEIDENTPVSRLTVGELLAILDKRQKVSDQEPRLVYGRMGLRRVLNCGDTRASKIINSGAIDSAIIRAGNRLLIFDVDKVLEELRNNPSLWKMKK